MKRIIANISTDEIINKLCREYYLKNTIANNSFCWSDCFESDFFKITNAGYTAEYEVKVSRSDFKADFQKQRSIARNLFNLDLGDTKIDSGTGSGFFHYYRNKHKYMANGGSGLKHFYFCTPKGLLDIEEIPEHCGLIEFNGSELYAGFCQMNVIKKAPTLKRAVKADDKMLKKIILKAYWKYYQDFEYTQKQT